MKPVVSINFSASGQFSITGGYYFGRPFFLGVRGHAPPGNFEIVDSSRRIFPHFEVYFYFALLFLEVNQFEQIWRKKKLNIYSNRFPNDALLIDEKKKKERDIKV